MQSILEICSVGEADDGQYSCTVGNALGNASVNFELSVTGAGGKHATYVHECGKSMPHGAYMEMGSSVTQTKTLPLQPQLRL